MASNLAIYSTISLFFFFFLLSPSIATPNFDSESTQGKPEKFCNSTLYPKFCKSYFSSNKTNIHNLGRISIRQTLRQAVKFQSLISYLLSLPPNSFPKITFGALEDCKLLSQLNVDSLSYTLATIRAANSLQTFKASDLQTLLSATLTNLQTCLDGIRASKPDSDVLDKVITPLQNGTKQCSISLDFFNRGWVPRRKRGIEGRYLIDDHETLARHVLGNGELALKMSKKDRDVFEEASKKRVLETNQGVLVDQLVVVDRKGRGNFSTINEAIEAAPNNSVSNGYFVIYVVKGKYQEYVSIPKHKNRLMMIGDGIGRTVITGNRSVVDGWTTFNSATFAVVAPGFVAVNISFRNTAGPIKHQAVAVRNGADMSAFYHCSFEGYQDTLYTHSLRQFYRECQIYGTVDFIFGNAAAVFQNCKIASRRPMDGQFNAITAQGRSDPNQNTGLSFQNCSIKAAKDLAESNSTAQTYLGRPWKEYSRTVIINSYIASFVNSSGWFPWTGDFALSTLYYAEFNNSGMGSRCDHRVTWPGYRVINATDASNFTANSFIEANFWLPATGVPYSGGLI
ncbi:Plant invertase/pectin methylesterase inhibitor superfamily [Euphorbia peplus]|nr:Plant invertase/pectin methylesterase inhibitor superfamily [Euphorbia peplus]